MHCLAYTPFCIPLYLFLPAPPPPAHCPPQSHQTLPQCRTPRFASSSLEKYNSLIAYQLVWLRWFVSGSCLLRLIGLDLCLSVLCLPSLPFPPNWKNILTLLISLSVMPLTHFVLNMTALTMCCSCLYSFFGQKLSKGADSFCIYPEKNLPWDGIFVFKLYHIEHLD